MITHTHASAHTIYRKSYLILTLLRYYITKHNKDKKSCLKQTLNKFRLKYYL